MTAIEWSAWVDESRELLANLKEGFSVFVDIRNMIPPDKECREIANKGQCLYKKYGMLRSVVILNSPVITQQIKQISHESGIYEYERYIDASHVSDWETIGLDWLVKSIDPDEKPLEQSKYL